MSSGRGAYASMLLLSGAAALDTRSALADEAVNAAAAEPREAPQAQSPHASRPEQHTDAAILRLPPTLPYDPDAPVPPHYVVRGTPRYGLAVAGGWLLAFFYLGPVLYAASTGFDHGSAYWLVPIAGPFLATARYCDERHEDPAYDDNGGCHLGVFAALPQIAGFTLLTLGLATKRKFLEREDLPDVSIAPLRLGPRGYGLGAAAAF